MKKLVSILLAALLIPLASAQLSQENAGTICNQYAGEGETVQVTGPVSCEGAYWLCGFTYFGNKQNVLVAVSRVDGAVLPADSDLLPDLVSVKYSQEYGASYIFNQFITDPTLAIELRGMNATMFNYENTLKSVKGEGEITNPEFVGFKEDIAVVRGSALELAEGVDELYNASSEFFTSPDCVGLLDYLDLLNETLELANNFSASWAAFISKYNTVVARLEDTYIAAINPSDAQIFMQKVAAISTGLDSYKEDAEDFRETVLGNLETRFERKETKDKLDEAYDIIGASSSVDATEKYNQASRAFSNGEYQNARRLINEAIALAGVKPPDDNSGPVVIVEEAPDYTVHLIAIGVLLAAILAMTVLRKRDGKGDEDGKERDRKGGSKKSSKADKWAWSKGGHSALERA